jgi:hypothetical protein
MSRQKDERGFQIPLLMKPDGRRSEVLRLRCASLRMTKQKEQRATRRGGIPLFPVILSGVSQSETQSKDLKTSQQPDLSSAD